MRLESFKEATGVWNLPIEHFSSAAQLKKQVEDLTYIIHRYADFWEWMEDAYGYTEKELWNEFEAWEETQTQMKGENENV